MCLLQFRIHLAGKSNKEELCTHTHTHAHTQRLELMSVTQSQLGDRSSDLGSLADPLAELELACRLPIPRDLDSRLALVSLVRLRERLRYHQISGDSSIISILSAPLHSLATLNHSANMIFLGISN